MKTRILSLFCIPLLLGSTLVLAGPGKDNPGQHRGKTPASGHPQSRHESWFHEHGYSQLDIPPGHYPPPGRCRVWFPDRPPGHQPPPVRCRRAEVPPGAWLIRHPTDRPDYVHITVYDLRDPGSIQVVGEFEIGSGLFVRLLLD